MNEDDEFTQSSLHLVGFDPRCREFPIVKNVDAVFRNGYPSGEANKRFLVDVLGELKGGVVDDNGGLTPVGGAVRPLGLVEAHHQVLLDGVVVHPHAHFPVGKVLGRAQRLHRHRLEAVDIQADMRDGGRVPQLEFPRAVQLHGYRARVDATQRLAGGCVDGKEADALGAAGAHRLVRGDSEGDAAAEERLWAVVLRILADVDREEGREGGGVAAALLVQLHRLVVLVADRHHLVVVGEDDGVRGRRRGLDAHEVGGQSHLAVVAAVDGGRPGREREMKRLQESTLPLGVVPVRAYLGSASCIQHSDQEEEKANVVQTNCETAPHRSSRKTVCLPEVAEN